MIKLNNPTPEWGHEILTPEGKAIRMPKYAFRLLRKLGVLEHNRAQLKPIIYQLLDRQYDDLLMGLRHLLGKYLDGPDWCVCHCRECQSKESQTDNTSLPGHKHPESNIEADTDRIIRDIKARRKIAA
jgi:hypothetical protein